MPQTSRVIARGCIETGELAEPLLTNPAFNVLELPVAALVWSQEG